MNKVSMLEYRWTGLRLNKIGYSSKFLKSKGFWKLGVGDLNNVNGFTHLRPGNIDKLLLAKELQKRKCEGILFQFTDLQWVRMAFLTTKQWKDRIDL